MGLFWSSKIGLYGQVESGYKTFMPHANRHLHVLAGRTYPVTHRCQDRAFLLKFARDRDVYPRERLTTEPGREAGRTILRESSHVYEAENRPENSPIGHFGGSKSR